MELKIKVEIDPQFTQTVAFLAAALGYPAKTMAQELKETAKEIGQKPIQLYKEWNGKELQKYCVDITNKTADPKKAIEEVSKILKKFKDKNGNPFQQVSQLVEQSSPEEVNEFVEQVNRIANT